MSNFDLFDLSEPKDLYRIIQVVYDEYRKSPTERNFLFLAFGFTHLREWIAQSKLRDIQQKQKDGQHLTDGEKFFLEIYDCPSFRIIQELFNRGKHHITCDTRAVTSKAKGLRVGIGRVGDALDQRYFLIDGRDSRELFYELIHKYNEWFTRDD